MLEERSSKDGVGGGLGMDVGLSYRKACRLFHRCSVESPGHDRSVPQFDHSENGDSSTSCILVRTK